MDAKDADLANAVKAALDNLLDCAKQAEKAGLKVWFGIEQGYYREVKDDAEIEVSRTYRGTPQGKR